MLKNGEDTMDHDLKMMKLYFQFMIRKKIGLRIFLIKKYKMYLI